MYEGDATATQPAYSLLSLDTKAELPISASCVPVPTLVGSITAGVASGVWGMTQQAAKSGNPSLTSEFEYKFKSVSPSETSEQQVRPQSGSYSGYFLLQLPGRTAPVKVVENAMSLEFSLNIAGKLNVRGHGENRYGPFSISGTCDNDGRNLELARVYAPKSAQTAKPKTSSSAVRKPSGKDLTRVQEALKKSDDQAVESSTLLGRSESVGAETDGKRSTRARKMPSHLRDEPFPGSISSSFPSNEPFKRCNAIVASLERSTGSGWFLTPVDAITLGVPHYSAIIDLPMDLGTVKHSLDRGLYSDPHAFATDMRLVFRNAMTFNILPEAPVHEAARDLHVKFQDQLKGLWKHAAGGTLAGARARVGGLKRDADLDLDGGTKRGKVTNGKGTGKKSGKGKKYPRDDDISTLPSGTGMVPVADLINMQRQMESMQATIAALQKQASQTEVQVQMNMELGVGTAAPSAYSSSKVPRFAKPLTFDEKEALSDDINALPPDKLAHVVKIVQESMPLRGRHDDDEIEVDIETLDNDTLRHLQKYVKASLSKKRTSIKKKVPPLQVPSTQPDISLTTDERTLASVAFGNSGLGSGLNSDEDDDELAYDVLGA